MASAMMIQSSAALGSISVQGSASTRGHVSASVSGVLTTLSCIEDLCTGFFFWRQNTFLSK
jgi:hypothetical protein